MYKFFQNKNTVYIYSLIMNHLNNFQQAFIFSQNHQHLAFNTKHITQAKFKQLIIKTIIPGTLSAK